MARKTMRRRTHMRKSTHRRRSTHKRVHGGFWWADAKTGATAVGNVSTAANNQTVANVKVATPAAAPAAAPANALAKVNDLIKAVSAEVPKAPAATATKGGRRARKTRARKTRARKTLRRK